MKQPTPADKATTPQFNPEEAVKSLAASVQELGRRTKLVLDSFEARLRALEEQDGEAKMLAGVLATAKQRAVTEALAMDRLARAVDSPSPQQRDPELREV